MVKATMKTKPKRKRGRPMKPMPDPIPDKLENVLRALVTTPPKRKDEWNFMKENK